MLRTANTLGLWLVIAMAWQVVANGLVTCPKLALFHWRGASIGRNQ
jgi:hypothetical protein